MVLAEGVVKRFGRTRALDGLDLTVRPGEVHGFLGPNGCGKTTTLRAVLGQLRLDGGRLRVFGLDPRRDAVAVHTRLAYVPGETNLWPRLTGGECLDLLGRLQGSRNPRRRDELVERFDLDPTQRIRAYSRGNRQKVSLIAALSLDVDLLLLDEPTAGLDPIMQREFGTTIREARDAGRTVLLSSHILEEVEELCDRVTIVRKGRAVASGTLEELRESTRTRIEATTARPLAGLGGLPGVGDLVVRPHGEGVRTELSVAARDVPDVVGAVAAQRPWTLVVRPPSLDELFLTRYGDAPAEEARP